MILVTGGTGLVGAFIAVFNRIDTGPENTGYLSKFKLSKNRITVSL
jgi:hypothetical protein